MTSLNYARSLSFDARPDYQYLRMLFRNTFDFFSYDDDVFDWNMMHPASFDISSH